MKLLFSVLAVFLYLQPIFAQSSVTVTGKVTNAQNEPVQGVNVGLAGTSLGSQTNDQGAYEINNVPAGTYTLVASFVGYAEYKTEIVVKAGNDLTLDIELELIVSQLDELVVTGTLKEVAIKDSPVKVNLISNGFLKKSSSQNIMDAIQYVNGLQNQVECAVCGTNNIRINGVDGPYTAVLIDGTPVLGALASVYSLNGINPDIIRNIEVIKGPNSTLYGSQAMGGVVNIITIDPEDTPLFSGNFSSSTHSENDLNFTLHPKIGFAETIISGNYYLQNRFIDQNNDNFSDLTQDSRFTLFNKWNFKRKSGKDFNIATKLYFEDRLGGTENFTHDLRGSSTIYGESIFTDRIEVIGKYDLPFTRENLRLESSYSYHDQDSFYGDTHYTATQQTYFTNLLWDKRLAFGRELIVGGTFRYDDLEQLFDGARLPGGSNDRRFVPGVFAQYDHLFNSKTRLLLGLRADNYEDHGSIFSPRLNIKHSPSSHTTLRLNMGTGFRIVNLFTEEHEALTGSRTVTLSEALNPERSFNIATNINQIIDIGPSILNLDVDVFYTHFTNQIIPIYDEDPNLIIYRNLDGFSTSRGVSISAAHSFIAPFTYSFGVTFLDAFRDEDGQREDIVYAPRFSSVFNATYTFRQANINIDYTARLLSRIALPEYDNLPTTSPTFTEHNIKFSKSFSRQFELFTSMQNIFNYTQNNPIISADQPFSDTFATDYVFGPIQGRRMQFGMRLTFN